MNILITGGSSGLGKATVELLAKESQNQIWFTYVLYDKHEINTKFLVEKYQNVKSIEVDFIDKKSVFELCKLIENIDIDVLVNSTYVGSPQSTYFHKIEPEEFLNSFSINLIPTIMITQSALLVFKKKKFGKIINILTDSLIGRPPMGYSIYASNKAYLLELSKVWNKEYTRYNITSNCIFPAYMQTDFSKVDERILEQMVLDHPMKKLLTPEEVALVIKFFIDSSQQINGVNLPINAAQNLL